MKNMMPFLYSLQTMQKVNFPALASVLRCHNRMSSLDTITCRGMSTDLESVNLDFGSEYNLSQLLKNQRSISASEQLPSQCSSFLHIHCLE